MNLQFGFVFEPDGAVADAVAPAIGVIAIHRHHRFFEIKMNDSLMLSEAAEP